MAQGTFRALSAAATEKLRGELRVSNVHALPQLKSITVASGVGKHRAESKVVEDVERGLALLTGQKCASRPARTSIAGFKVRQGQVVGYLVTLRGRRMEEFLLRLLNVAIPRVRDFRGISLRSVDARGNLTIGFREASVFPEVDPASVEAPFGIQVTLATTARNRDEGIALFRALGFPFAES